MSDIGIGAALRDARSEQERSREEAAAATSMRVAQVEALEDEQFHVFGGDVYAKGFMKSYARWLGLDPEPLLALYRKHVQYDSMDSSALTAGPVTSTSPRPAAPAWVGWVAGALLVLGVGAVLAQFVGSQTPAPAAVDDSPPPAPVAAPEDDTQGEQGGGQEQEPEEEPSPEPTFEGVNVTLAFEEDSWVRVSADGTVLQEGLQTAGAALDFRGNDEVTVRIGNAGGVRARLNGEGVGVLGEAGDVIDVRFTPDGFEVV